MEQRTLRLGDILDDYCTRERRVTNHAIVAMVEQDVKQTRCNTCDTEHVYKGGKAPRRKKPETAGALYKEVLAGITDSDAAPAGVAAAAGGHHAERGLAGRAGRVPPSGGQGRTGAHQRAPPVPANPVRVAFPRTASTPCRAAGRPAGACSWPGRRYRPGRPGHSGWRTAYGRN